MAEAVVNNATPNAIIEEVERLIIDRNYYKDKELTFNTKYSELRKRYDGLHNAITEFLKEHVRDNEDADVEELMQLAADLNIELTKKVRVTFNVEVEYEIEVGLDDEIDENDFNVRIDYHGEGDVQNDNYSIVEFDAEDND